MNSGRPRKSLLVALGVVIAVVAVVFASVRLFDGDGEQPASRPGPDPLAQSDCIVRLTARPAVVCVTSYDATQVTYKVSGFKPKTAYQTATPDGTTRGGSKITASGTNFLPRAHRVALSNGASDGFTFSSSTPLFANGLVITGTAANDASVTFFVPPPDTAAPEPARKRTEMSPGSVDILDDRHLLVGATCNPYGPAVQVRETAKAIRIGVFVTLPKGLQLMCLTRVRVTLPSPLGARSVVANTTGEPLRISSDNR
jgi:hypothetical protein